MSIFDYTAFQSVLCVAFELPRLYIFGMISNKCAHRVDSGADRSCLHKPMLNLIQRATHFGRFSRCMHKNKRELKHELNLTDEQFIQQMGLNVATYLPFF